MVAWEAATLVLWVSSEVLLSLGVTGLVVAMIYVIVSAFKRDDA